MEVSINKHSTNKVTEAESQCLVRTSTGTSGGRWDRWSRKFLLYYRTLLSLIWNETPDPHLFAFPFYCQACRGWLPAAASQ